MKTLFRSFAFMLGIAGIASFGSAQTAAPAGSTGKCKDGTYSSSASKSGACRGHQGVKEWSAAAPAKATSPTAAVSPAAKVAAPAAAMPAPKPAVAAPVAPSAAAAPASAAAKSSVARSNPATMQQAAGGGPGMVWVNTGTKVYHCPGNRYYGKTKEGSYMTEAAAKAAGARGDAGKTCSK